MEGIVFSFQELNKINEKINQKELKIFEETLLQIDAKLSKIEAEIMAPPPVKFSSRAITTMALLKGPLYLFFEKPESFLADIEDKTTYQQTTKKGIVRSYNLFNTEYEGEYQYQRFLQKDHISYFYLDFYKQRCSTIFKLDKSYPNQTTSRVANTKYLAYCFPEYTNDDRKLQALTFMNGFKLKAKKKRFSDVFKTIMGKAINTFPNYTQTPYLKAKIAGFASHYGGRKIADFPAVQGLDDDTPRTTFYKTLNVFAIFLDNDIEIVL